MKLKFEKFFEHWPDLNVNICDGLIKSKASFAEFTNDFERFSGFRVSGIKK